MKVRSHRKLPSGGYRLVVDTKQGDEEFIWPSLPEGMKAAEYEAMQLREAKLLLEEKSPKGRKLKSEGTTL